MIQWLPWIILLTPLLVALSITFGVKRSAKLSIALSLGACGLGFLGSLYLFTLPLDQKFAVLPWISVGGLEAHLGMLVDTLARVMLLVVTGIGLVIQIFSIGYMHEDKSIARFFAKLSLFMFSMLGIVLADNLVMMFIFWELVGLSSYLLIGFWHERPSAVEASKKAFLVNRIGDFGFLLGILLVWQLWGTVQFTELREILSTQPQAGLLVMLAGLGLFCGCVGKSAQFPLHVWLPDAMEGPTPVSALIHAATMVAAGVYMLARVHFILELDATTMHVIAWTGGFTALFAALIATQQTDIKRILAYSTLSQLGYMVMAVGLYAHAVAMFHLVTHACFKALLFLAAGSVIHGMHHQQNIWRMGGLRKSMPITAWTFLIGTAALTGVPLLSGFFSKEMILLTAFNQDMVLFSIGLATAVLTAYYMYRLWWVAFCGEARSEEAKHAHESPRVMYWSLIKLACPSILIGYVPVVAILVGAKDHDHNATLVMILSTVALLVGLFLARKLYSGRKEEVLSVRVLENKFYMDELYQRVLLRVQDGWVNFLGWFDRWILAGVLVRGSSISAMVTGEVLRLMQGGNLKAYVAVFVVGVLLLFYAIFMM